jgi:hypothetical protein
MKPVCEMHQCHVEADGIYEIDGETFWLCDVHGEAA